MTRYPDWQSKLHQFFKANLERPFAWGTWDCCLFVADAVQAMTGTDIAAAFRGKYSDEPGAMRAVLAALGGNKTGGAWPELLSELAAKTAVEHAMAEVAPLFAQRGDMVVTAQCLGLVSFTGQHVLVIPESGFHMVPLEQVIRAWRVG